MEYIVDDKKLDAFTFIAFVKQVWQGNYDIEKTQCALSQTINITAYENEALIGCLRILTDGYFSVRLQSCSSFLNIKNRESAVNSCNLQRIIPLLCCILERSRG